MPKLNNLHQHKLLLDTHIWIWVEKALTYPGINLLPLSPTIAINSNRLPENPHGDPSDRIIIATAHEHNALLVTHDKKILAYGKGKFLNVYDPC